MKTTALIGLVSLSLIYAIAETNTPTNETLLDYEHRLHTTTSVEESPEDMSRMKAMGKCGADQKAHNPKDKKADTNMSKGLLEYEHRLQTSTSVEDMPVDMSRMKAMGKCGADQKAHNPKDVKTDTNMSEGMLDYEHRLQTSTSVEDMPVDMSKMKAMGKCGADQKAAK